MRILHYLEIENFKRFGERRRIELDHPAVLIGPNDCGKTTVLQAISLWSYAVQNWWDAKGANSSKDRPSVALNRLAIVSVPVLRTRHFWRDLVVRRGNREVALRITAGVECEGRVRSVGMRFRNYGDDLVYCFPDDATREAPDLLQFAADLKVDLLYPQAGLAMEEPVLQPRRIRALLGEGQTGRVLRNLCLVVYEESPSDWKAIADLMARLFLVELEVPRETGRGLLALDYRQKGAKGPLDISLAGRGMQQMLLLFASLFGGRGRLLLVDEPDAHLEILRQRQAYVLLREVAARRDSQIVMVTHSETILREALDRNLTFLLRGSADNLADRSEIADALRHYGAEHYVRARERGYALYVEGRTDLDLLRAFAERLEHPVLDCWDERINAFYVQDNHPDPDLDSELERVEGGYGVTPTRHFFGIRGMVPGLRGLAILDRNGRVREDTEDGGLRLVHWQRYEIENYFVSPELLERYALSRAEGSTLFDGFGAEAGSVLDALVLERVFRGRDRDFALWKAADPETRRLLWEAETRQTKLSEFAEEFFRRLADRTEQPMLLRKGDSHQLIPFMAPEAIPDEVGEKLDILKDLFDHAEPAEEE